MKKYIFILLILLICGCSNVEKAQVMLSSNYLDSYTYSDVVSTLKQQGFTNIEVKELYNLKDKDDLLLKDKVYEVSFNDDKVFDENDKFPLDSIIKVTYNSYLEEKIPVRLEEVLGKELDDVKDILNKSNFFNIEYKVVEDTNKDNIYDYEIENITINNSEYNIEDLYDIDSSIIVYYSIKEEQLPISSTDIKGKSLDEVIKLLENTKFNINKIKIDDKDYNNIHNQEVEYIEINSNTSFTKEDTFPINSTINIYYSDMLVKAPISSSNIGIKTYKEIISLFEDTNFTTIKKEGYYDLNNIDLNELKVDKITINGKSSFTEHDYFTYDSEIMIYYSIRTYNVKLNIKCRDNLLFDRYDVKVYVDNDCLGTLAHGEKGTYSTQLKKGTYTVKFVSCDDSSIVSEEKIKVTEDNSYRYYIHCSSNLLVKYYEKLDPPVTNDTINNRTANEIKSLFEKAGFEDITLKELNDLNKEEINQSGIVSKITINDKENYTSKGSYYCDSDIVIYYHSGKLITVPIYYSDCKGENYKTIVDTFKDAGFTNVKAEVYTGNYDKKAMNNTVHHVEVDGESWFFDSDEVPMDAKVVVYYYSYKYESVKVSTMVEALENNAYAASKKYTDGYFSVTGYVKEVSSDGRTVMLVQSSKVYGFVGVTCTIIDNKQKDVIATLSKGQKVTIKGKISYVWDYGYDMYIHTITINK